MTKAPPRECELKFKARVGDLTRFKKAVNTVAGRNGVWPTADLVSRYFDTKEKRLAAKGVAVRVRHADGRTVQTVKAGGGGGAFMDRSEWETPVEGPGLDLDALPGEARRAMGVVIDTELAPILETAMQRQTAMVRRENPLGPDLVVEIAADKGTVTAGDKSERFAECELELVQGDIGMFFQFASEINALCPLPLSNVTKSERGYRLLDGKEPTARRAPKFALTADETIHEALAEVFSVCTRNVLDNEAACLDGKDPEGVHQMRVSIRRMRASLNVFRPYIERDRVEWLREELKWLGSCLGPARDWDVYIDETVGSMSSYGIDDGATRALRRVAERKRKEAYGLVRETLGSQRYARLMFRLTAFVALEGWLSRPLRSNTALFRPLTKTAAKILRRPYRKLIQAAEGLAGHGIEARHEVRIRLKKVRYAVDFLQGIYPEEGTKDFLKALRDLQDRFGSLNDVAQAMKLTDELTGECGTGDPRVLIAAGQVRGWYARALTEVEQDLLREWQEFAAMAPFWEDGPGS